MRRLIGTLAGMRVLACFCMTAAWGQEAAGQATPVVPRLIRFSGTLKQVGEKPVVGVVELSFSLFKEESGGEPLWFESQTVEVDAQGRYNVLLGAMHADGLPMDLFTSGEARWLSIMVGKAEQPRILLVSVPYALKAADADSLGGRPATAFVATEQLKEQVATAMSDTTIAQRSLNTAVLASTGSSDTPPALINESVPGTITCSTATNCLVITQSAGAHALLSQMTATSGAFYGVYGLSASTTGTGTLGLATATTGASFGVRGQAASTSGYGVHGLATAATGTTYGMWGQSASTSGRGIFGYSTATTGVTYGILGTAASTSGVGLMGQEVSLTGSTIGLRAETKSPNSTAAIFDNLGGGKLISARTTGFVEKFSVNSAGNVVAAGSVTGANANFTGSVVGTAFVGDGSGLTVDGSTVAALLARIQELEALGAVLVDLVPPGGRLWAKGFGDSGNDDGRAIALDENGDLFVTGYFQGTVDFGGGPLTSAGQEDIFVAKFSGVNGAHLWSKRFGDTTFDEGYGIAVDGSGNVLVTGAFHGTVDFGGGALMSAGGNDIFVAKFSGANGAHLWSKRFGDTLDDSGVGIATDGSGDALVTGNYHGTVNFGGGGLMSAGGDDIFVAKFSGANGAHLWSKRFGDTLDNQGVGIATDGSGNVLATGHFKGTVDFGGGGLTSTGDNDIYVTKFSGVVGTHLWSKRFGDTLDDQGVGIATDGSGNVLVTGYYRGTVDFGGGGLTSTGDWDIYVAKFSGVDGAHLWSKRFGDTLIDFGLGIAVDGSGNVAVTGLFSGTVDFGGGGLTSAGTFDIFVAKFSGANGTHLWSKRFGGTIVDLGSGIAVDGSGNVLATGNFLATVDFGGEALTSAGALDIFVLKLRH